MPDKIKILIVSGVVPTQSRGGGCLALYRHFCEKQDFEVAVASRSASFSLCATRFELRCSRIWGRLRRTWLERIMRNYEYLSEGMRLSASLLKFCKEWKPQVIFTVADDEHLMLAEALAKRLGIPLAVDFQDLFACSQFVPINARPYRWVQLRLLERYRRVQAKADAVFHTSQGMKAWFGVQARGDVLYPVGNFDVIVPPVTSVGAGKRRLVYAGNCYGTYGRMLLELAEEFEGNAWIRLEIYTMGNDWPEAAVDRYAKAGVLKGYLPFSELKKIFAEADAFVTVMSFLPLERDFVRTSFTTKWLDYAPFAKPIFVWAPDYSSAVEFAKRTGAGEALTEQSAQSAVSKITITLADTRRCTRLAEEAAKVAAGELNAERLHSLLRDRLSKLVVAP